MNAMIGRALLQVGVFAGKEYAGLSQMAPCGDQQRSHNARNRPFPVAKK
jgi:hypothetical protein